MSSERAPLEFVQQTKLGGCALINHTDVNVSASIEYDDEASNVHLTSVQVNAKSHVTLPVGLSYKLVHKDTRATLLRFESWSFALLTRTPAQEFVVRYVRGPVMKNVDIQFFPAIVNGLQVSYLDPVSVEGPDEWQPGDTFKLKPNIPQSCLAGKFVMRAMEGQYDSMIPWSLPSIRNPLFTMGAVAAPLLLQSLLATAVQKVKNPETSVREAIVSTLMTSLVTMHGPSLMQEVSRGMSPMASQVLPRPIDSSSADGWKRAIGQSNVWAKIIASVAGTALMSGKSPK